jgi:hypothetical protein
MRLSSSLMMARLQLVLNRFVLYRQCKYLILSGKNISRDLLFLMLKLYKHQVEGKGAHSIEFMLSLMFHTIFYDKSLKNEVHLKYKHQCVRIFNYSSCEFPCSLLTPNSAIFKIPPACLIILLKAMLLEKKVILISSLYENNAILIESLIWLMFPM